MSLWLWYECSRLWLWPRCQNKARDQLQIGVRLRPHVPLDSPVPISLV